MRGAEIMKSFLPASPFAAALGFDIVSLEPDRAVLRLPFDEKIVTIGDVVHGGAIATLVDTTAMAAAWCTDDVPESMRGTTVALNVSFVSAARAADLTATGTVVKRGGTLCHCEVEVTDGTKVVAKGLVTYKLG
ncbi:MAG TPA: PaaI family thioesterase [Actinomycetota bacterium]|jgi:uncharacterized protein (TIGR00369 family)